MHPEERAQVCGRPRLAVVEAPGQDHARAQRAQDGGPAQVKDGQSSMEDYVIFLCIEERLFAPPCHCFRRVLKENCNLGAVQIFLSLHLWEQRGEET